MKRIALLCFGLLLLISNTAEARRYRRSSPVTYSQPATVAPASYSAPVAAAGEATTATHSTAARSTATAQGVANIMAAYNQVGHWGGNPGYEGCGCGATPQAAYSICCYGNSGMATVDVGYAQSASGMWYCCRRYR